MIKELKYVLYIITVFFFIFFVSRYYFSDEYKKKSYRSLSKIEEKINIVDLVLLSKLENSKSEIRRLIKGNAVKINNDVISDEKFEVNKNLFKDNYLKLSLGKKRHIKIELN